MAKFIGIVLAVLGLSGCHGREAGCEEAPVWPLAAVGGDSGVHDGGQTSGVALGRTITVQGDAEVLTAPDRFVIAVGFDLQATTLDEARDGSRSRAAALLEVVTRRGVAACDVQTERLSLQPRYEHYGEPGGQRLVGYQASRGLILTLHSLDEVEGMLHELLAAGANRVDSVRFESSALLVKRSEARVLAVAAARAKAEAMAAALGQRLGEPLRVEEGPPASAWQPPGRNYVLNNETAAQLGDTVATGKVRVHAGVSVVFSLRAA